MFCLVLAFFSKLEKLHSCYVKRYISSNLLFVSSSEENGMDQENTNSEEEVAVLTLYKFLCQCTGR